MISREEVEALAARLAWWGPRSGGSVLGASAAATLHALLAERDAAIWNWQVISGDVDTSKAPWDGKWYLLYDPTCDSEYMSDRWDDEYHRWDCAPEATPTHYCNPIPPEAAP